VATRTRDFAERILLGTTLADKLFDPGVLEDRDPGRRWRGRAEPGRAPALEIADHAAPFVRDAALADPRARGRALHFFANHELLALELMALALLRFADAPPAFRRGLAATIRDEQRHLSLYLERMRALGTQFGELPLGGFFWRTVAALDEPRAWVAHMSLTFEQANLDHARYYREAFAARGDPTSAALMDAVYTDEIKHVGFGLHWFRSWRDPERADQADDGDGDGDNDDELIERHAAALVAPVSLRRARGRGFDRAGRARAGLPPTYIDAIENLPSARGRAPVVHLFEPTMERELGLPRGYSPDARTRARIADLEALPLFYAAADDAVLVREAPRPAFVRSLREAGVAVPEFVVAALDGPRIDAPELDEIARVEPWGWTPKLARRLAPLRDRSRAPRAPAAGWPASISSKATAVAALARLLDACAEPRLSAPESAGVVVESSAALELALARLRELGYPTIALKAPWGSSGRGTARVLPGPIPAPQRAWIDRILAQQGALIVEPWLERALDLSLRLTIEAPGRARIDGLGRVFVDARGQYGGALIGRATLGLAPELARFVHGDGRDPRWLDAIWDRVAAEVAATLAPSGYVGTVGVDAFIHRGRDGSLRLRPLVELNTRVHMGHVAVALERLVTKGSVGVWRLLAPGAVPDPLAPIELRGAKIRAGVLATNDPSRARVVVGLLAVAGSLAQAEALLNSDPNPTGSLLGS